MITQPCVPFDCREGGMARRPATSSLPVKPVTPRTWKQMQFEAAPGKLTSNFRHKHSIN